MGHRDYFSLAGDPVVCCAVRMRNGGFLATAVAGLVLATASVQVAAAPPRTEDTQIGDDRRFDVPFAAGDMDIVSVSGTAAWINVSARVVGWDSPFGPNWEFGDTGLVVEFDTDLDGVSNFDAVLVNEGGVLDVRVRNPARETICTGYRSIGSEDAPFRSFSFPSSCIGSTPESPARFRWAMTMSYEDVASGVVALDLYPDAGWAAPMSVTYPTFPSPYPGVIPPPGGSSTPTPVRLGPLMLPGAVCTATTPGPAGAALDGYTPLDPWRVADSRLVSSTENCSFASFGTLRPGQVLEVNVGGRGNVPVGARGAVLNVTATEAIAPGFLTVYSCDRERPVASSLNYRTGTNVANAVFTEVSRAGVVCIFAMTETHVVIDITGYFSESSGFVSLTPSRVLDTRGVHHDNPLVPAGTVTAVTVGGGHGVPTTAAAAALNVTVDRAAGPGFVTVFPCGNERPNASNLNFEAGATVANAVVTKLGTAGQVCLYNSAPVHLVIDVNGAYTSASKYRSIVPSRLLDTRPDGATVDGSHRAVGVVGAGTTTEVIVAGRAGVAATATSAMLNVTATESTGPGYVTVHPCGSARPTASTLNLRPGASVPNAVLARIGVDGKVCIYTSSTTHLVVDVNGFSAP